MPRLGAQDAGGTAGRVWSPVGARSRPRTCIPPSSPTGRKDAARGQPRHGVLPSRDSVSAGAVGAAPKCDLAVRTRLPPLPALPAARHQVVYAVRLLSPTVSTVLGADVSVPSEQLSTYRAVSVAGSIGESETSHARAASRDCRAATSLAPYSTYVSGPIGAGLPHRGTVQPTDRPTLRTDGSAASNS